MKDRRVHTCDNWNMTRAYVRPVAGFATEQKRILSLLLRVWVVTRVNAPVFHMCDVAPRSDMPLIFCTITLLLHAKASPWNILHSLVCRMRHDSFMYRRLRNRAGRKSHITIGRKSQRMKHRRRGKRRNKSARARRGKRNCFTLKLLAGV